MNDYKQAFVLILFGGFLATIVLISLVFATGSTFGQRCTDMGYTGLEYDECVLKLSKGEYVNVASQ